MQPRARAPLRPPVPWRPRRFGAWLFPRGPARRAVPIARGQIPPRERRARRRPRGGNVAREGAEGGAAGQEDTAVGSWRYRKTVFPVPETETPCVDVEAQ